MIKNLSYKFGTYEEVNDLGEDIRVYWNKLLSVENEQNLLYISQYFLSHLSIRLILIKSNVIMKRINFNQRPTPVTRGSSRATCENSTKRMWELVVTVSVPSGFSSLICSESVVNPLSSPEPLSCALLWS